MTKYEDLRKDRVQATIYIEKELKAHFEEVAEEYDTSFSAVLSYILNEQMEEDLNDE